MTTYRHDAWRDPHTGRPLPLDDDHAQRLATQKAKDDADWHLGSFWTYVACVAIAVTSVMIRAYVPNLHLGDDVVNWFLHRPTPASPPIDWMSIILSLWTFVPSLVALVCITAWRALRRNW